MICPRCKQQIKMDVKMVVDGAFYRCRLCHYTCRRDDDANEANRKR